MNEIYVSTILFIRIFRQLDIYWKTTTFCVWTTKGFHNEKLDQQIKKQTKNTTTIILTEKMFFWLKRSSKVKF